MAIGTEREMKKIRPESSELGVDLTQEPSDGDLSFQDFPGADHFDTKELIYTGEMTPVSFDSSHLDGLLEYISQQYESAFGVTPEKAQEVSGDILKRSIQTLMDSGVSYAQGFDSDGFFISQESLDDGSFEEGVRRAAFKIIKTEHELNQEDDFIKSQAKDPTPGEIIRPAGTKFNRAILDAQAEYENMLIRPAAKDPFARNLKLGIEDKKRMPDLNPESPGRENAKYWGKEGDGPKIERRLKDVFTDAVSDVTRRLPGWLKGKFSQALSGSNEKFPDTALELAIEKELVRAEHSLGLRKSEDGKEVRVEPPDYAKDWNGLAVYRQVAAGVVSRIGRALDVVTDAKEKVKEQAKERRLVAKESAEAKKEKEQKPAEAKIEPENIPEVAVTEEPPVIQPVDQPVQPAQVVIEEVQQLETEDVAPKAGDEELQPTVARQEAVQETPQELAPEESGPVEVTQKVELTQREKIIESLCTKATYGIEQFDLTTPRMLPPSVAAKLLDYNGPITDEVEAKAVVSEALNHIAKAQGMDADTLRLTKDVYEEALMLIKNALTYGEFIEPKRSSTFERIKMEYSDREQESLNQEVHDFYDFAGLDATPNTAQGPVKKPKVA